MSYSRLFKAFLHALSALSPGDWTICEDTFLHVVDVHYDVYDKAGHRYFSNNEGNRKMRKDHMSFGAHALLQALAGIPEVKVASQTMGFQFAIDPPVRVNNWVPLETYLKYWEDQNASM